MSFNFGPYDQFALAAVVLIGTYAAAFALLWVTQRSPYASLIGSFRGIAQNFLTVINVIFALNLAFLANDTWNARDRALDAVYHEAGSLQNLMDLAGQLPQSQRSALVAAVETYARLAVTDEWPRLARREHDQGVGAQLDTLVALVASKEVTSSVAPPIVTQLLQQAVQVRNTRELRIALSQTHVNPLKWLGMIFLGFLTMISIAMVHVDNPRAQFLAVVLFATAAAPTAAIILIHGNPFQHPMAIASAPIGEIAATGASAQ